MTPGKGSKYREFYDLSGPITCMGRLSMSFIATSVEQKRCVFDEPHHAKACLLGFPTRSDINQPVQSLKKAI